MIRARVALLVLLVALCACQAGASPSVSAKPLPSAAASGSGVPSEPAGASGTAAPTTEPVPSDQLGEFSCDLPVIEQATATGPITNILDVRVGTHDGYDRVVFEFAAGTPDITLDRAKPPFDQDPSGRPLDVVGTSFLGLLMRGGTKQTESGTSSYDGPTDFDPGFPQLADLVEGGDFEAQSTWYLGLNAEACVRVLLLTDPDRLVIDVQH